MGNQLDFNNSYNKGDTLVVGENGVVVGVPKVVNRTESKITVDNALGNDATGAKYDSNLPYKTILQAMSVATAGDIIHVKTGLYQNDYNIPMKFGVILHLEKGAVINPTANGGNVKIFQLVSSSPGIFEVSGKGRILNVGSAHLGTPVIENGNATQIVVDCEEISSVATWNANASLTVNNAKITSEIYTRFGKIAFNNCFIIDAKTTTFNVDWGDTGETIYNACTFLRKQATIPWEVNFPTGVAAQGSQGLDNYKFGPTMGSGASRRKTIFIGCYFINNIGGNGISFKEGAWDDAGVYNPTLVISNCKFMLSDNTKNCVLADGSTGVPVSASFYFDNNVSNGALGTINGGTLVNKLSGSGFQIAPNYKIINPFPYLN